MIKELSAQYPARDLCRIWEVSTSGYYRWLKAGVCRRQRANEELGEKIKRVFVEHKKRYGSPRVTKQLREEGIRCSENRVARLMKIAGLRGRKKRAFRPRTTVRAKEEIIAPNLLAEFGKQIESVDRLWVGDITYIATEEGYLYLAALMDYKSRKIVGWALEDHMKTELCEHALEGALAKRAPFQGLIVHSDRGSQYTSRRYQRRLKNLEFKPSMSAIGYCYDNAKMESFWSTLKTEALPENGVFKSFQEARLCLFEYIEIYYNRKRLHSALGYKSPQAFEDQLNMRN